MTNLEHHNEIDLEFAKYTINPSGDISVKSAKPNAQGSSKNKGTKLSFVNINVSKFNSFLDRFLPFDDNNLLLEITPKSVIAKAYLADHSSVKYSAMSFDEVLQVKDQDIPDLLKIGLINIKAYKKALDYLDSSESVSFLVNYLEMSGYDDEVEYVSTYNVFNNNKNLKFTFDNGSMQVFQHISEDQFFNEIAYVENPIFKFSLDVSELAMIKKYAAIDKDKNLTLEYKGSSVYMANQNFKYKLNADDAVGDIDSDARFEKSSLLMLDVESYDVEVAHNKVVFSSRDSKTVLVLGRNDGI